MFGLTNIYKYKKTSLAYILVSCILYLWFAFGLERTEALKLVILYSALFFCAYKILKASGFYFRILAISTILFRILFLLAIPNLSQDFYRFIWDGQMIIAGFNPYLTTPDYQMEMGILSNFPNQIELYEGMGTLSASHYTNYPPLNQLCFILANLFPGKSILSSVIGMRLIIIAADLGTLYFGKKLLERFKLPSNRIFWYILNPFIIIEFTGNLHFEGVMIFFLIWSLYLLHSGKWKWAAVILGCSISVKLIPLMFLPLFFWWFMGPKKQEKPFFTRMTKLIGFYFITITTVIAFFFPFISMELINNYSKTVGLWFGNFEFNASIYYLAREIGYAITGYNEIAIITKILPVISILVILGFALFKSNNTIPKLSTSILLAFTLYLFLSTTVHPWYLSTLVILGVFTNYRYPIIWSLVIILSYLSYLSIGTSDKSENLWIIGLEYGIIFAAFIWEILLKKPIKI
jgi:hypothetical protein